MFAEIMDVPKSLIEGVSYPATPRWNIDRPYLTGQLFPQVLFCSMLLGYLYLSTGDSDCNVAKNWTACLIFSNNAFVSLNHADTFNLDPLRVIHQGEIQLPKAASLRKSQTSNFLPPSI
jgi:hypothetical protein